LYDFGLATTQQQAHNRTSVGFTTSTILVSQPHNSKLTIELLKVLQQYDFGLATTQQQAHNRTPAGFTTNTIMVS